MKTSLFSSAPRDFLISCLVIFSCLVKEAVYEPPLTTTLAKRPVECGTVSQLRGYGNLTVASNYMYVLRCTIIMLLLLLKPLR